jgi:hypothetical protein
VLLWRHTTAAGYYIELAESWQDHDGLLVRISAVSLTRWRASNEALECGDTMENSFRGGYGVTLELMNLAQVCRLQSDV